MAKARKLPDDETLRQLVVGGLTRNQIADRFQVHRTTLGNKLKELGLRSSVAKPEGQKDRFSVDEITAHIRAGMSFAEIDRHYGKPHGTTWCFCRTHRLLPNIPDLEIRADKIIRGITYAAAEKGGTSRMAVSLPRISMHAAELRQPSDARIGR